MTFSLRHPTYRDFHTQLEGFDPSIRCEAALGLPASVLDQMDKRLLAQIDDQRYAEGLVEIKSLRSKRRSKPRTDRRPRVRNNIYGDDALKSIAFEDYGPVLAPDCDPNRGRCHCPTPGHEDRRPSCTYKDGIWHCFSCGEGGDIYTLASLVTGLDTRRDFPELRRWLAERLLGAVGR